MAEVERDQEIAAIEALVTALEPLSDDARARVLDYTLKRLGMREVPASPALAQPHSADETPDSPTPSPAQPGRAVVDIRTLRDEKAPQSANEMAAVAAYYLAEAAPYEERKDTITSADLERLFKQASYPLPSRITNTLPNAASAGYFDTAGRGAYRLNPVGHNLVTQTLPRSGGQPARSATRKRTPGKRKTKASPARKRAKTSQAKKKSSR